MGAHYGLQRHRPRRRPGPTAAEDVVYAMLDAAAQAGEPCPSGAAIAERLGVSSIATASRAVSNLEDRGLIAVVRTSTTRIVTIVATGQSTGEPPPPRRGPWRAGELADLVADGASLSRAAATMGLSQQRVNSIWQWIRDQLGWQAC